MVALILKLFHQKKGHLLLCSPMHHQLNEEVPNGIHPNHSRPACLQRLLHRPTEAAVGIFLIFLFFSHFCINTFKGYGLTPPAAIVSGNNTIMELRGGIDVKVKKEIPAFMPTSVFSILLKHSQQQNRRQLLFCTPM
jgi:hypothetical protein